LHRLREFGAKNSKANGAVREEFKKKKGREGGVRRGAFWGRRDLLSGIRRGGMKLRRAKYRSRGVDGKENDASGVVNLGEGTEDCLKNEEDGGS